MGGNQKISLRELNALGRYDFVHLIGPVFEHSPWIAESAWAQRPFANWDDLLLALHATVGGAGEEKQLSLIRDHPDLAGRAAVTGSLTRESAKEQAGSGLDRLSPEEIMLFTRLNAAYREKFGFPFVICARLNKKEAMLAGFESRLKNTRETEVKTALEEIFKIAELRLRDRCGL
jgi:2-oxo-4-hydroxy-4-carboxy-5-ureidoimidazoline decarboxylase